MTTHDQHHQPTREEALAVAAKPLPKVLGTISLVLAVVGAIVFLAGVFLAPERAWRAFHTNWLFWTSLSSAGVTFVAVQRITTARWSRAIIRFLEGYVAFLPISFFLVLLTLSVGAHHVFPWTEEAAPVPEKAIYFDRAFLTIRVVLIVAAITAMSLWYI